MTNERNGIWTRWILGAMLTALLVLNGAAYAKLWEQAEAISGHAIRISLLEHAFVSIDKRFERLEDRFERLESKLDRALERGIEGEGQ